MCTLLRRMERFSNDLGLSVNKQNKNYGHRQNEQLRTSLEHTTYRRSKNSSALDQISRITTVPVNQTCIEELE